MVVSVGGKYETNPWLSIQRGRAPYVADVDRDRVILYEGSKKAQPPDLKLITSVVPEPWCGPIRNACVMVLSGNPHWDERDNSLTARAHDEMWLNLSGTRPLFWLDEDLSDTTGGRWYRERLLKSVLEDCCVKNVASGLCLVDFVGYRSHRWDSRLRLPSQEFTVRMVRNAMFRGAVFVVTRGRRPWFSLVPELAEYDKVFFNRSAQMVRISPKNTGGHGYEEVVKALT
jgi:hypothetical protein